MRSFIISLAFSFCFAGAMHPEQIYQMTRLKEYTEFGKLSDVEHRLLFGDYLKPLPFSVTDVLSIPFAEMCTIEKGAYCSLRHKALNGIQSREPIMSYLSTTGKKECWRCDESYKTGNERLVKMNDMLLELKAYMMYHPQTPLVIWAITCGMRELLQEKSDLGRYIWQKTHALHMQDLEGNHESKIVQVPQKSVMAALVCSAKIIQYHVFKQKNQYYIQASPGICVPFHIDIPGDISLPLLHQYYKNKPCEQKIVDDESTDSDDDFQDQARRLRQIHRG